MKILDLLPRFRAERDHRAVTGGRRPIVERLAQPQSRFAGRALGALEDIGALEAGKRADIAFWRIERPAELCYGLGANPCVDVMCGRKLRVG